VKPYTGDVGKSEGPYEITVSDPEYSALLGKLEGKMVTQSN